MLHSSYDPQKEAERFVQGIQIDYMPEYILITEPALSYTAAALKQPFPNAKLLAVRYSHAFEEKDNLWNKVFYIDKGIPFFENELFNALGEEGLLNCLFLSWQPSEKAFEQENKATWTAIKNTVKKSQSVLATRSFFAQRWIKNICTFFMSVQNFCTVTAGTSPVIIAASGPSLSSSIPFLKKYRKDIFLIAVSSAIEPLLYQGVMPDLFFSTDGGFYARGHLFALERYAGTTDIPIALPAEAACPASLLEKRSILPLSYQDFPESDFFDCLKLPSMHALRNGTVSGTAVQFALSITAGNVYCCGLDMAEAKGFQHTQPNELEIENAIYDGRLKPQTTRLSIAGMPSQSLAIYRNWFSEQGTVFKNRVKRIRSNYTYTNRLGTIEDCLWSNFSEKKGKMPVVKKEISVNTKKEKSIKITKLIENICMSESWLHNSFPADFICWKRSSGQKKEQYYKILNEKNQKMLIKIRKLLHE